MAPIYEKSTRLLMRDAVGDLTPPFSPRDIVDWFGLRYPKIKPGTVAAHVSFMTANNPNRRHHNYLGSQEPLLFSTGAGLVPYDPALHGEWTNQGEPTDSADGAPLVGFSQPVPFTKEGVVTAPTGSAVHVVFDENGEPAYVGKSGQTRNRLRDHLSGDRQASALHKNLGEELDKEFGTTAAQADIEDRMGAWSVSWLECPPEEMQSRKEAVYGALRPRLGRRLGSHGGQSAQTETVDLEALVAQYKAEVGYPNDRNRKFNEQRLTLVDELSPAGLDGLAGNLPAARTYFNQIAGGAYGSPGNQSVFNTGLQDPAHVAKTIEAVRFVLYGNGEVGNRIDAILTAPGWNVHGFKEAMATKVLAITDPARWIPNFSTGQKNGKIQVMEALGLPALEPGLTVGQKVVRSNDAIHDALLPYFGDDAWGMMEFGWWLLESGAEQTESADVDPLAGLAERLFLSEDFLKRAVQLLKDRRQVVFYGPPGTGKTYVARELAALLARDGEVMKVQFHPSYAYEDFVEGYRPRLIDGQASFELIDGPLKEIAAAAAKNPDAIHVLLIDELNRGNVAKVLGELFFLLEYRDEKMRLQYSAEPFFLPKNLWLIGTMNTADRSIALVDAALRRRFHFIPFFPDQAPVQGLLARWLKANRPEMTWVADLVDSANGKLDSRHLAIGPSHFMRKDLDDEWLGLVWEYSVLPYLAEQFFGDEDRLEGFALSRLKQAMSGAQAITGAEASSLGEAPAEPVVTPTFGDAEPE